MDLRQVASTMYIADARINYNQW